MELNDFNNLLYLFYLFANLKKIDIIIKFFIILIVINKTKRKHTTKNHKVLM